MRILFVSTHTDPLAPPINGDGQRTCLLYQACLRIAQVDVVTFVGQREQPAPKSRFEKWRDAFLRRDIASLFPVIPKWESIVDTKIREGNYDYIVARYFYRAASCGLLKYREKLIVDFDDDLPFYFLNQITEKSSLSNRIRMRVAAKRAAHDVPKIVRTLRAAFFAEESVAKRSQGVFLPNIPYYSTSCADVDMSSPTKRIVFVGQLEYLPNKEGVEHFLESIYLPLIERIPEVELHLVGRVTDDQLRQKWQQYPHVTVTGFVKDLAQEYADSHVVVVPIYRCGATNIKLLEAMQMNRACVTTKEVYERMNGRFENRQDLYVASSDDEFVEALVTLLGNEEENRRIARHAKETMDRYFSFDSFSEIVKKAIVQ